MADIGPLVQKATKEAQSLEGTVLAYKGTIGSMEDIFKKQLPPEVAENHLKNFERDLGDLKKKTVEAEKVDAELDGKLKSMKTPDPAAKKASTDLGNAIKSAKELSGKMDGHLKIFTALLVKVKQKWVDDAKWLKEFETFLAHMEKAGSALKSEVNVLNAEVKALGDTRNFMPSAYAKRIQKFEQDVKALGAQITTADSIASSYDTLTKNHAQLEYGKAVMAYKNSLSAKAAFDAERKKARTAHGAFLNDLANFKKTLKAMGG